MDERDKRPATGPASMAPGDKRDAARGLYELEQRLDAARKEYHARRQTCTDAERKEMSDAMAALREEIAKRKEGARG